MALSSYRQAARDFHLKNLLVCFSLGNLCLHVRRWYDLKILQEPGLDAITGIAPYSPVLLFSATLVSGLIVAAVYAAGFYWARRGGVRRMRFAQTAFLLTLIFPLDSVRRYWERGAGTLRSGFERRAANPGSAAGSRSVPGVARQPAHCATGAADGFDAHVPVSGAIVRLRGRPHRRGTGVRVRTQTICQCTARTTLARPRMIWMIFDEMDQRVMALMCVRRRCNCRNSTACARESVVVAAVPPRPPDLPRLRFQP